MHLKGVLQMKPKYLLMTKAFLIEFSDYNSWANGIVCDWLHQISDQQWEHEVVSSFSSIQATVLHIISAEHIWLQRMNMVENTEWLADTYKGTRAQLIVMWIQASEKLKKFALDFNENNLPVKFNFRLLNKELDTLPFYQVFAHVFNHSTFHRGQLIIMLRQVGYTQVRSTDMLEFFRNLK
jgi:uncharacterized damage-inducible protein DinB